MARKLDGNYITANTITTTQLQTTVVTQIQAGGGPKVTTITYPNSATAAVNTGNESIVLTGTGFESGVQVYINGSAAPAVSRTNSTSLSFTTPALSTGTTYPLYVVNPDGGTAVVVPGMVVSAGPVWVTASPLTSWGASSTLSTTLVATSDSTISYALADGSSLPSGITLAANGLLSGTLTSPPGAQTTYNFTVTATDLELQKSSKAFSINATIGITATGGTVSNIAGYRVHTFTSSGTFDVTSGSGTVEYLVVAGGGSGGTAYGGGGGAGGFRTGTGLAVTAGNTYTVTVGAGGAARGASPSYFTGDPGSNSQFGSIISTGGGGGGTIPSNGVGLSGGSGGGGGYYSEIGGTTAGGAGNTPATSPSQGNNGGSGANNPVYGGGGGGGAGAAGGEYRTAGPAAGGAGLATTITGSSTTYAGGGGGGTYTGTSPAGGGAGGAGGGGAGGFVPGVGNAGVAGTVNTGGGGGGGGGSGQGNQNSGSGAGGSGIVIIRYAA